MPSDTASAPSPDRQGFALMACAVENGFLTPPEAAATVSRWAEEGFPELPLFLARRGILSSEQLQTLADLSQLAPPGPPACSSPATAETATAAPGSRPAPRAAELPARLDRYQILREIGRGGMGAVFEAVDRGLGRRVAIKVLRADLVPSPVSRERFIREARIAGRLEHPAAVPVHEMGQILLPGAREPQVFFCMKYVVGRSLHQLLRELRAGDAPARRAFTRTRLLQLFHALCLGVAYAHDMGIIHRDLKPHNVMVGNYGETLILDWGLAKFRGTADSPVPRGQAAPAAAGGAGAAAASLTEDGDILGTPAYLAPEQARGEIEEVDERTDLYGLGAILYEILTTTPPYEGANPAEVLARVRAGPPEPPGARVARLRRERGEDYPPPVPPGLEEICLKALAPDKAARFASAREIGERIQAHIEGLEEKRRQHELAEAKAAEGMLLLEAYRQKKGEWRKAREEHENLAEQKRGWTPLAELRALWASEDRLTALRQERINLFTSANGSFTAALWAEHENLAALRGKATLMFERFLEAEAAGDEDESFFYRRLAELYDRGELRPRLQGDGRLFLETRAYPCSCLAAGRPAAADWAARWDADRRQAPEAPAPPAGELGEGPARLFAHGPRCRPQPLAGVEARLFRYVEEDRVLVARFPREVAGGQSGRDGEGLLLGRTPLANLALPMGSYLLLLRGKGFAELRLPFAIGREQEARLNATLFAPGEVPPDFCVVPGGPAPLRGDTKVQENAAVQVADLPDFFLAARPVTCAEYLGFLAELAPAEAEARAPRVPGGEPFWILENGTFRLPGPGERPFRGAAGPQDWSPRFPVTAVSWADALAYCRWYAARARRLVSLPHELEWEKAGRGADGRFFPWGNYDHHSFANLMYSHREGARLLPAGEDFPADTSPYGARDLAGNVMEWCLNPPGGQYLEFRAVRGGHCMAAGSLHRLAYRLARPPELRHPLLGFRLACYPGEAPAKGE